jgi:hypothetical protein
MLSLFLTTISRRRIIILGPSPLLSNSIRNRLWSWLTLRRMGQKVSGSPSTRAWPCFAPRRQIGKESRIRDRVGAYGCNMSMRSRLIGSLRFDERLALRQYGRMVEFSTIIGAHLGLKAGRVSGVRFGYSQIVNPVYLINKGSVPATFAVELMARNITANLVGSFWPEPWIARRERLRGNLLAAFHLTMGRIQPEYILRLPLGGSPSRCST